MNDIRTIGDLKKALKSTQEICDDITTTEHGDGYHSTGFTHTFTCPICGEEHELEME